MHSPDRLSGSAKTSCMDLHLRRILNVLINENQEEDLDSARRYMYHLTFQTIEEDTVWSAVMDSHMDIKQVRGGGWCLAIPCPWVWFGDHRTGSCL